MWLSLYGNLVAFGISLSKPIPENLTTNKVLNEKKTVSQIWCHFKASVSLIFNVAYDFAMLKNNIVVFGCSKAYCTLEKKKINHFRNKSIPIEENCQYFPELSYTLVLLLYILNLSYVLILIRTTQFMLKYNYNVWLFLL